MAERSQWSVCCATLQKCLQCRTTEVVILGQNSDKHVVTLTGCSINGDLNFPKENTPHKDHFSNIILALGDIS